MNERTHKKRVEAEHVGMDAAEIRKAKGARTKARNAARRRFRIEHPEHRGKKLRCWPIAV